MRTALHPMALVPCLLLGLAACGAPDRAAVQGRLEAAAAQPERLIAERDLEGLPPPLARYLRRAGVVGHPFVRAMRARGPGEILKDGAWLSLDQAFYATLTGPSRDWLAETGQGGLALRVAVHDSYADGVGRMAVKLFEDLPFMEQRGPEMDVSGLVTLVAEFMHVPTAFLHPNLRAEALGPDAVRVWFTDAGAVVSATLHFDAAGDLVRVTTEDRFRATADGAMEPCPWSAECLSWTEVDGLRVCNAFQGVWHRETGDEVYARGRYEQIDLDVFELF